MKTSTSLGTLMNSKWMLNPCAKPRALPASSLAQFHLYRYLVEFRLSQTIMISANLVASATV